MEISSLDDTIIDIVNFFESFCIVFNQYANIIFIILKYIFVIVLIGLWSFNASKSKRYLF